MSDLAAEASAWGIDLGYHDVFGGWHVAPEDTVRAIVKALRRGGAEPAPLGAMAGQTDIFQGDGRRVWGISVQLYAVRSDRNWGIGDFTDLAEIVRLASEVGAATVGVNPLHALFLDRPQNASPYAPNSRLFLNPLYVDVEAIAEFDGSARQREEIEAARASDLVDYPRVAALKLEALRRAYDRFRSNASDRKNSFESFRAARGDALRRFACFEVLTLRNPGVPWPQWPEPWRSPQSEQLASFYHLEAKECGFYEYLQWLADQQLQACTQLARELGLSIGLYLDVAVGIDPHGADAWSNQSAVLPGFSIGAPPDEFNPAGQNWGLAAFDPQALIHEGFAPFRRLLDASMIYSGAIRLDHVIGLMRLYLIPSGGGADAGTYLRYPFELLLNVIAEESHRHHCIFVGEDLGTVPEGFHRIADRWGMWSYRVMLFERGQNGEFKPPAAYPQNAVATFNTHDLPTYTGWTTSHDLAIKGAIGVNPGESEETRGRSRDALRHALQLHIETENRADFSAVAAYLAATPSRLTMVGLEDLLAVPDQINMPGTIDQYPNWRRKLPLPILEWPSQKLFEETVRILRAARASTR